MKYKDIEAFIRQFGPDAYFARLEGCTTKSGEVCTGNGTLDGSELWYEVKDTNGYEYETQEMPAHRIDMSGIPCNLTEI